VQLLILRTARYDDTTEEVGFGEISVFLAPTFVITVRQGTASGLRGARQRLEQRPERLAAGSWSALWAILDQVAGDYAPVVAGLERDIDQVEATVFSGAVTPIERIYLLRREATDFYRAVHPLLGVVTAVERAVAAPPLLHHLLLVNEEAGAQRDLLGTVLEANMAVISVEQTKVSVRQNASMEQLTILATVFLPLTVIPAVRADPHLRHGRLGLPQPHRLGPPHAGLPALAQRQRPPPRRPGRPVPRTRPHPRRTQQRWGRPSPNLRDPGNVRGQPTRRAP
jgi:magnesium transporter